MINIKKLLKQMTIEELYDWAVSEGVEDYTIIVRQNDGSTSLYA